MKRFPLMLSAAGLVLTFAIAACGATPTDGGGVTSTPPGNSGNGASAPTAAAPTATTSTSTGATKIDLTKLPLGDGHVSTSPQVGYVFSCQTQFNGSGAFRDGPWIQGSTWDEMTKIHVQGAVPWPQASYSVTVTGGQRVVQTMDVPLHQTTGVFPIASSDPAFQFDRNPNTITPQMATYTLTASPTVAASPSCLSGGPIGVLKDGVVLFDALDAAGRDAEAHEVLDSCDGHPERTGMYHHHGVPSCILKTTTGPSTLVGYAFDGFGIYVERDASGNLLTDAALDACHGRTSEVMWNGTMTNIYHYDATYEYPYTLGCFMGTPIQTHPHP